MMNERKNKIGLMAVGLLVAALCVLVIVDPVQKTGIEAKHALRSMAVENDVLYECQRTITDTSDESMTYRECNEECKDDGFCTGYDFIFSTKTCTFFYGIDEMPRAERRRLMPPMMDDVCIKDRIDEEFNGFECVMGDIAVLNITRDECETVCSAKKCTGYRYSSAVGEVGECTAYIKKPNDINDFGKRCHRLESDISKEPDVDFFLYGGPITVSKEPDVEFFMDDGPITVEESPPDVDTYETVNTEDEEENTPEDNEIICPCISPENVKDALARMELDTEESCKRKKNGSLSMTFVDTGATFAVEMTGRCTINGQVWLMSRKEAKACRRVIRDACP